MKRCILHAVTSVLLAFLVVCSLHAEDTGPDLWEPVRFFLGEWTGGDETSDVTHTYRFVLGNHFIKTTTRSVSHPREGSVEGEVHEDEGFFSYDPARKVIVFRQFLSEGYVNTYVLEPRKTDSDPLVFSSEHCEGAGSIRARLIYTRMDRDQYRAVLELAFPGKEFSPCQTMVMKRRLQ